MFLFFFIIEFIWKCVISLGLIVREHRLQKRTGEAATSSANEDEVDFADKKIERDIQELSKMSDSSGAAKVFLEDLKKLKMEGAMLDPRSASRVPSAANEPPYKPRYESSVFACKQCLLTHALVQ